MEKSLELKVFLLGSMFDFSDLTERQSFVELCHSKEKMKRGRRRIGGGEGKQSPSQASKQASSGLPLFGENLYSTSLCVWTYESPCTTVCDSAT